MKKGVIIFLLIVLSLSLLFVSSGIADEAESENAPRLQLSEIHYQGNINEDYVEFYVFASGNEVLDVNGWFITTFDADDVPGQGRGRIRALENALRNVRRNEHWPPGWGEAIPEITNLGELDYVAVYMGDGENDLDASDGNATIYLGLEESMLESADEVGLFDDEGQLIDFVRYNGGNSELVLGNWNEDDPGIIAGEGSSIQIHGEDIDSSFNWVSSSPSPAAPNIFEFSTNTGIFYQIHNGLSAPFDLTGGPWHEPGWDIHNVSRALSFGEIKNITEFLNYSYNYLNSRNLGEPETGGDGDVDVHVTNNGNFGGNADNGNRMDADMGNMDNFDQRVMNKRVLEHEQVHLFQYKNSGGGWGPSTDWSDLEGMAEYWSVKITMAEFGITYENYTALYGRLFHDTPTTWLRDPDRNFFTNFTAQWDYYWANHMFLRWIESEFGENKVRHIFMVRNITSGVTGMPKVVDKAFQEQGRDITFASLFGNWTEYLHKNFPGDIRYTFNGDYNDTTVDETGSLQPWGTDYELLRVTTPNTFNIVFQGHPGVQYTITLIKTKSDGSVEREQVTFTGSTTITIYNDYTQIVLIKNQLNNETAGATNYNVTFARVNDGSTIDNSSLQNTTWLNVTLNNITAANSVIRHSTAEHSLIEDSRLSDSRVSGNSMVRNSNLHNVTVINSTVINSTKRHAVIINSVDINSIVTNSRETNSHVTNSNVSNSHIENSSVSDSGIADSRITGGSITGSKIADSQIDSSSITNSRADDSILRNITALNSEVQSGILADRRLQDIIIRWFVRPDRGMDHIDPFVQNVTPLGTITGPGFSLGDLGLVSNDGLLHTGDTDLFSFDADAPFRIQLFGYNGDYDIYLTDGEVNVLNFSIFQDPVEELTFDPFANIVPRPYYLVVAGWEGLPGEYVIEIAPIDTIIIEPLPIDSIIEPLPIDGIIIVDDGTIRQPGEDAFVSSGRNAFLSTDSEVTHRDLLVE